MPWEPLFPNPNALNDDSRWRYTAEWNCIRRACAAAGLERVPPNILGRHAFITHEVKRGSPLFAIRQVVGHASLQTTKVYFDDYDAVELARTLRPAFTQTAQEAPKAEIGGGKPLEITRVLVGDTGFEPVCFASKYA
jgi:integrase